MLQTSGIDNLFVSALLPSLLLRKAVRQRTSTHAPLIPSLTWVQVERGASRLQAKFSKLLEYSYLPLSLSSFLPQAELLEYR
jgi:hypothetical protein